MSENIYYLHVDSHGREHRTMFRPPKWMPSLRVEILYEHENEVAERTFTADYNGTPVLPKNGINEPSWIMDDHYCDDDSTPWVRVRQATKSKRNGGSNAK